ncbi:MAG TPA: outer membrane beta-barrel protein [Bacteroidia bacterium]|nr:outer membrane beta-barrel protein [Bacteroidia bacterium]
MKRILAFTFFLLCSLGLVKAQDKTVESTKPKTETSSAQGSDDLDAFDKQWRFGLRFTPQPTWFSSNEKNISPNGTIFGYGFGLHIEYRFSKTVGLVTGLGGDIEGGKYSVSYDTANSYAVRYWLDSEGDLKQPESGTAVNTYRKKGNTECVLKERQISTTYLTIPAILKMSTKELNGFKYYGMFGGELGIRIKTKASDSYYESYTFDASGTAIKAGPSTQDGINLAKDCPLIPMRLGMNLGLGTEYRFSGSTSLMFSVNYFQSFVNVLQPKSDFLISNPVSDPLTRDYTFVKQSLLMKAVRINIGILF